jgi:transcriptional regulator with XRE-family HTH domain
MPKFSERDRERLSLFVDEMVAQRAQRGWSQADLAREAQYSKSLISQVEIYERAPTKVLSVALDRAFVLPETFVRLHEKVRAGAFPAAFGEFAAYEAKARTLLIFEHSYIPGLFQTEMYAHAVLNHHFNTTPEEVSERAAARLARQEILRRQDPPPPVLWFLIDEFVLYRDIASPDIMADQLSHLTDVATLPNVSVQVIPRTAGAHPGLAGTFYVAEFDGEPGIVFSEDITDGRLSDDPATVANVTQQFRYLTSQALPADLSIELIKEAQEQWATAARGVSRLSAVPTAADASK